MLTSSAAWVLIMSQAVSLLKLETLLRASWPWRDLRFSPVGRVMPPSLQASQFQLLMCESPPHVTPDLLSQLVCHGYRGGDDRVDQDGSEAEDEEVRPMTAGSPLLN